MSAMDRHLTVLPRHQSGDLSTECPGNPRSVTDRFAVFLEVLLSLFGFFVGLIQLFAQSLDLLGLAVKPDLNI